MRWVKRGLIYAPGGELSWAEHSALQPSPWLKGPETIRVFVGFRDKGGVSRVGYVDVSASDPSEVLTVSKEPVLDIGAPGAFDDNGVVPCVAVPRDGKLYLYYSGYQLGVKVRFFVFGGLAVSEDGGASFKRVRQTPLADRRDGEMLFRVVHCLLHESGRWKVWYGAGGGFVDGVGKTLPVYDIRYLESLDGFDMSNPGDVCIGLEGTDEYRVGRPSVIHDGTSYKMFYSTGTRSKGYRVGYAESEDGLRWKRKDDEVGMDVSESGWDSEMIAYTSLIQVKGRTYMFYNGNNYGRTGFGYAELIDP